MDDLVVSALQKGRINRCERTKPLCGKASTEGHAMLFGDAHIETAIRKLLGEEIKPGSGRHGSRHGNDALVFLRLGDQRFSEHLRVLRRLCDALALLACEHIEFDYAMIFVG